VGCRGALGLQGRGAASDIDWLNRIIDWQADVSDPAAFMENLKTDLEQDEVFVFTPKGPVVTLPVGSTTVDFAYAVHTEVGHACIGAKVNGRLVPLNHHMRAATRARSSPPRWSHRRAVARLAAVRGVASGTQQDQAVVLSRAPRRHAIENGRDELIKELRREGLPIQRMWTSDAILPRSRQRRTPTSTALLAGGGRRSRVGPRSVAQKVARPAPRHRRRSPSSPLPRCAAQPRATTTAAQHRGVHVEGLDDVLVRLSRCCTPVPGDDIIGFVTRGRGVSVHRTDCANAESLMSEQAARLVEVEWDGDQSDTVFRAAVEVVALDRSKLLRDVANSLSEQHVNIVACSTHTGSRSGGEDALRVRAGRPLAPRIRAAHDQDRSTPSTTRTAWCPAKGDRTRVKVRLCQEPAFTAPGHRPTAFT
jgi:guanosine-3',5'-bis(diphosphate) 3'-pyrophosphohydrolase